MWLIYVFTTPKEILCGVGVCVGGGIFQATAFQILALLLYNYIYRETVILLFWYYIMYDC